MNIKEIPQKPSEWVYKGEGNENAVFSYAGNDPELRGWLLRLSKCKAGADAGSSGPNTAEIQKKLDAVAYSRDVIGTLIGSKYVLPQTLVSVSSEFLSRLSTAADGDRPGHRKHKQIDVWQGVATLTPDMLFSSFEIASGMEQKHAQTVTVELKPKWGFLPTSRHISKHSAVKLRVCRYCMHQYLKHDGERVSQFCPLDLFSGNRSRILHALDCLSASPQNNLRIFVNGHSIVSGDSSAEHSFSQWQELKNAIADVVLQESLFSRLKHLQRQLDSLDIEGIMPRHQQATATGALPSRQPSIAEWAAAADAFRQRDEGTDNKDDGATGDGSEISDMQAVLEFLLAATLKDISVLIRFHSWPNQDATRAGDISKAPISDYKVVVIDTDPKKLSKVPDYNRKDQDIVANFLAQGPSVVCAKLCHE
ncbi:DUF941-domain-containing protein [Martensiomyces pterosporus]|nr:DUF941-domain-containing protein [Martensiomyces pterosporus]